ncbi:MAG TPA: PAS domain S-box protein [Casimicrobiaceae bacterium]|nr:PAS domain S-box protein [Casimicrobiaceae bacterium]
MNQQDSGLTRIIRGLTWTGTVFLILTAVAIVWAVFRTRGIDDLITALTVTGLGFGLPAVVAFVVAWLLGTFDDSDGEERERTGEGGVAGARAAAAPVLSYLVAIAAVGVAWALRAWLDPILGREVPYITFFLAVATAAWAGGIGPALLASLLSLFIAWYFYVGTDGFRLDSIQKMVSLGLFVAVSLCVAGITSAVRAAREQAQRLVRDAVERQKALEQARVALAHERDRMAITLASIGDGVIATDGAGNVTFMNATAEKLTGWSADEAQNRPIAKVFRVVDEEARQPVTTPVEQVIATGELVAASDRSVLISRRGVEYAIDDSASPIKDESGTLLGSVLVFRDITAARRARASLEESESRFRLLADQTPAMLWLADESRAQTYFNRSWLDFTGRTMEQEIGDGWTAGVHPEDFAHCLAAYASAFEQRESFETEFRLRRYDGDYRWVFNRGRPRYDADGRFAGYIGAALDVTDRKAAEEALGHADRRRNEFLAMLAHELRNPLAPIRNAIQIMARVAGGQDRRVDHARDVIDRQSAHLTRLIDDLLEVSRIDSGKITLRRERVVIQDIVRKAVEAQQALVAERRQTLDLRLPDARVYVNADATRLTQAFGNVINNAAKFSPEGGRIEVSMTLRDAHVDVTVADNGVGIEPALLPHLFDLFNQGADIERRAGTGLGLGLSIVQRLVQLQGGDVRAESAGPGHGSRFTVTLPLADPVAAPAGTASGQGAATKAPAKVLVVDDNVDAAEAIATLLQFSGYDIEVAHDPHTALETAARAKPDLVLLDIGLPGMSGYEVAQRMRDGGAGRHTKIVALTGYGQEQDNEQAKAAGFSAYLVKPVDADQLTALVNELTDER